MLVSKVFYNTIVMTRSQKFTLNTSTHYLSSVDTLWGERWHSGRAPCPCVLCLPQTYLRL